MQIPSFTLLIYIFNVLLLSIKAFCSTITHKQEYVGITGILYKKYNLRLFVFYVFLLLV